MKRHIQSLFTAACTVFVLGGSMALQATPTLNYQGRIMAGHAHYTGVGRFKFALVKGDGTVVWTNDGSHAPDGVPLQAVSLDVGIDLFLEKGFEHNRADATPDTLGNACQRAGKPAT